MALTTRQIRATTIGAFKQKAISELQGRHPTERLRDMNDPMPGGHSLLLRMYVCNFMGPHGPSAAKMLPVLQEQAPDARRPGRKVVELKQDPQRPCGSQVVKQSSVPTDSLTRASL